MQIPPVFLIYQSRRLQHERDIIRSLTLERQIVQMVNYSALKSDSKYGTLLCPLYGGGYGEQS